MKFVIVMRKSGGGHKDGSKGINMWIDRNSMIDRNSIKPMGFIVPNYTWTNKRYSGDLIIQKLDKGLCNGSWRKHFLEAFVRDLLHLKSDHCPLLICFSINSTPAMNSKLFHFEALCFYHDKFKNILATSWNPLDGNFCFKLANFAEDLKTSKKEIIRNIFHKKKIILARVGAFKRPYVNATLPFFYSRRIPYLKNVMLFWSKRKFSRGNILASKF